MNMESTKTYKGIWALATLLGVGCGWELSGHQWEGAVLTGFAVSQLLSIKSYLIDLKSALGVKNKG